LKDDVFTDQYFKFTAVYASEKVVNDNLKRFDEFLKLWNSVA